MKIINEFKKGCWKCETHGYITELDIYSPPYEQAEVDLICVSCNGLGWVVDKDELDWKISEVEQLIKGMKERMNVISDLMRYCHKNLDTSSLKRYENKLDNCSRGLLRLERYIMNLKQIN